MSKTIQRYSLNANQIRVLKLLYKFRFVTASLLARYKGISRISSNKTLRILLDQKYIGSRYDKSYKIQGKGASFFLDTKALTYLRDKHNLNAQVLHALYKNKTLGDSFIEHHLDVMRVYLSLRDSYPGIFHIFSKTELASFNYFPEPRPDLYLNRIKTLDDHPNECMVDILSDTQFFVLKKRIAALIEHFDSGEWESGTETSYPAILLVCHNSKIEEKLQTHIAKILDNTGIDDLKLYTTTLKALSGTEKAIWSDVVEPEKLVRL